MIKPKYSFKKKNFEIREEFVDREEAKALYRKKLRYNERDYNVLSFYGLGGIGKTSLRKELCRLHHVENPEAITFYLDLHVADDRNMGAGILKLVDSCDVKIDFKCFEMAYGLYFRKKNPCALYGRDRNKVTENAFVGMGLNILSVFDNGLTGAATELVESAVKAIVNRTIDREVKEELQHFDEYSITEMEERLPLFFQYDLMSYLEKHKDAKVLIVFDTFEALNENVIEQVHRSRNERWIQEIIQYFDSETFPNLLFLIFGRDEIAWDEEWNQILEQCKLEEFDNGYAKEYLQRAGIRDSEMVEVIAKNSKGYPLLLYLMAETYANIKNSGKKPKLQDFKGSYPEIIERFLYNLDKNTVEVLRLMAIPNYYNTELFQMMIKEFNISFPLTEYEQFNKYSFVHYDEKEDEYYIHDLIRTSILEKTPEQIVKQGHKLLLKYFSEKVREDVNTKYVLQMFNHARKCLFLEEFDRWLGFSVNSVCEQTPIDVMKKQQERGEQSTLIQMIDGIRSEFSLSDLRIDLANIYIDVVHLGGDYEVAVDLCRTYLANRSVEEIYNDKQLLRMRIRKIHHSMFFVPVRELLDEAKRVISKIDFHRFPEEYNELLFLIGGNLGVLSGQFHAASFWLEQSMEFAKERGLEAFVHRTIRKQADILLYRDDFLGALKLVNQTVDENSNIDDINSRYKIYLMALLGEIYRKKDELESAWHCFEIVDKKCTENYMPGWQAHSYLGKGMVRCQEQSYEEAETYFQEALSIYEKINQKWGIINTKEAVLWMRRMKGEKLRKWDIEESLLLSNYMNYCYNEKFAERLLEEEIPYLQLFFL